MSLDVSRSKTNGDDRVCGMDGLGKEIIGEGKTADRVKHWKAWVFLSRAVLEDRIRLKALSIRCSGAMSTIDLNG